ncbi:MAG TPA: porin [Vicinamibacterales bacterium]|nr:porin [Vicinamibacterales bacterium]
MLKQMMRVCVGVVVSMVISGSTVEAQTQPTGWPGQEAVEAKPVKAPVVSKPAAAAAPAKPAASPKSEAPKPPAAKSVAAPKVVEVKLADARTKVETAAPAVAPVAKTVEPAPVVAAPSSDVVLLLQQQSELLKTLAAEMESQRVVIEDQQAKITSLEAKASESPAPAVTAPAPPPPPPPPPPAITVETGGVKLKVSGLFQGWYTASDAAVVDTFRLRRAELKFAGDISPRIKWTVMVDPAKALSLSTTTGSMGGQTVITGTSVSQGGRIMQDAFVALNWKPAFSIEVGQQKVPLGMEGTVSSGKLDVVERALFMTDKARGAGYADLRDFGVMVRGRTAGGQLEYSGGVFNGLGEAFNDVDRNEDKTMVGRLVAKPKFIKGLQFGASMSRDRFELSNDSSRERQGVEMAYARGVFGMKAEFMGGRDAAVTRHGGYAQVTARVRKALTAVVRFDTWDPDTRSEASAATVTERAWLGGFTYVLHPSGVWLQGNYIRKTFDGLIPSRNVFMTNVQTAW